MRAHKESGGANGMGKQGQSRKQSTNKEYGRQGKKAKQQAKDSKRK